MTEIKRERMIMLSSIFVVFLGFLTALRNGRSDHLYRTLMAMAGLSVPLVLPRRLPNPPEKLRPFLAPVYNERTMAVLSIFIAVHVSLVNVPFTGYDLFHRDWGNADIISHFLGGLAVWLIVAEILSGLESIGIQLTKRQVVLYSFVVFYALSLGWEIAEKLSESWIGFITESLGNKLRDLIMDTLGALFGLWIVTKKGYPFSPPQE
ncbi:hypothetical protein X802_04205 [Thermococcus guaymasensis DSM 11113]|uniref:Uncharacterized protein n=1 Tax=Thermococcus guaymasensis DSM 11113 TaxID=1432656 RepID=A0A0X1KJK4_9EURY|nr:hypothetical protein [Thermococcus guaymasensis]AJC71459.1 hypothetical protein X802_04205 [Thermococcus guaymasensis DSM 11113]